MPLTYTTGEEIKRGDRITYQGELGRVEFVMEQRTGDPDMDWYIHEFGPGIMLHVPTAFGTVYVSEADEYADLIFVSRYDES